MLNMEGETWYAGEWLNQGAKSIRKDASLAKRLISQGIKIMPTCGEGWYNLGLALHQDKRISEAIRSYRMAIQYSKSEKISAYAKNNLAQDLLLNQEWEEGFRLYEKRLERSKTDYRPYIKMYGEPWLGWNDPRKCQRLIVVSEQGFGDTLQFIRLITYIREKGIKTSFFGPEELRILLRKGTNLGPFPSILRNDESETRWCSLMSIPHLIKLTSKTKINNKKYIEADPKLVNKWKKILKRSPHKKLVALHWQGNPKFEKSIYSQGRSMPFDILQKLKGLKDTEFLSIQKGSAKEQIKLNNTLPMVAGQAEFDKTMNFEDTAAALICCDLLISADSGVVHLAGALGVPVWVALSWVPEWRWGMSGTQSLWHETAYLFRQKKAGDWEQVIKEMRKKLQITFPCEPISA